MPNKLPSPCNHPGCRTACAERWCAKHKKHHPAWRARGKERETPTQRGYGHRWKKLRTYVIGRSPLCEECTRRRAVVLGEVVDHITPKSKGGSDDTENLQTLCKRCHSTKTRGEAVNGRKYELVVVTGAPCSGKTTYVREHIKAGDIVFDLDAIGSALSLSTEHEYSETARVLAIHARRAVLSSLSREVTSGRVWLVQTEPTLGEGDRLVTMDTSEGECLDRLGQQPERRADEVRLRRVICEWFGEHGSNLNGSL